MSSQFTSYLLPKLCYSLVSTPQPSSVSFSIIFAPHLIPTKPIASSQPCLSIITTSFTRLAPRGPSASKLRQVIKKRLNHQVIYCRYASSTKSTSTHISEKKKIFFRLPPPDFASQNWSRLPCPSLLDVTTDILHPIMIIVMLPSLQYSLICNYHPLSFCTSRQLTCCVFILQSSQPQIQQSSPDFSGELDAPPTERRARTASNNSTLSSAPGLTPDRSTRSSPASTRLPLQLRHIVMPSEMRLALCPLGTIPT